MGDKFAVIIAIENYRLLSWNPVRFAKADADELSDALTQIGFPKENQRILIDSDATKARIDSILRRTLDDLQEDDELLVYYAGHGFSDGNHNYLTCHDSETSDKVRTSLSLQEIFDFLRLSSCKKVSLFLDSCHSGPVSREEDRGMVQDMDEGSLRVFFRESEYFVCFSSCKTTEKSYPSKTLGHGIWTHYLIEAFRGNAPDALERGGLITSRSLQDFLSSRVPLELRKSRSDLVTQTPTFYGSMTQEFLVADVTALLSARRARQEIGIPALTRLLLRTEKRIQVRSLSGFKKTHHVPDEVNDYTEKFLIGISKVEIEEEVNVLYETLRKELGYKRRQIESEVLDGAAEIRTPDFSLELSIGFDEDNPSCALLCTQLVNITNSALIASEEFNRAFSDAFNTIEFSYDKSFDVEGIVDMLDEHKDHRVEVDCPRDASYCRIKIAGMPFTLLITSDSVQVKFSRPGAPRQLIDGLRNASTFLLSEHNVFLLPASDSSAS